MDNDRRYTQRQKGTIAAISRTAIVLGKPEWRAELVERLKKLNARYGTAGSNTNYDMAEIRLLHEILY